MQTRTTLIAAALLAIGAWGGHAFGLDADPSQPFQDVKKDAGKNFQVPKDAIKGTVKAVELAKNTFTIVANKKDRVFTVTKTTEFWGPNGGDRGTGPAGLKDDCMAVGYEIQVMPAKDAKLAKDVYLPNRKGPDPKKDAKPKEMSAAALKKIAATIAGGHSYQKHVVEEKLFPEVKSEKEFAEVINKVLVSPTHHRGLENDRQAFYDIKSNTIVIYNPHAKDNGTCFRPRDGLKYYQNLK